MIAEEVAAIKAAGKILVASAGNSNTSVTPILPGLRSQHRPEGNSHQRARLPGLLLELQCRHQPDVL